MYHEDDKKIVGQTVKKIFKNDAKDKIAFILKESKAVILVAEGDCCSTSWFESFNDLDVLIGRKVVEIVNRDMPQPLGENPDDCIAVYGTTFVTNRGRADLEMRNQSNGYYGGYITVQEMTEEEAVVQCPIEVKSEF